jgi:hypothetical protein
VREGGEHPRGPFAHDLLDAPLVRVVDEGPQQRDGDRLDVLGQELVDGRGDVALVERHEHLALAVDALGDAPDEPARDDRLGLAQPGGAHEVALGQAGHLREDLADEDRVLVAAGGDEASARAGARDHRVGRLRRAVDEQVGATQQLRSLQVALLGVQSHRLQHAVLQRPGRREGLGHGAPAVLVGDDAVGERAADVHRDAVPHLGPSS